MTAEDYIREIERLKKDGSEHGGKDGMGQHIERPRDGYDGQVTILSTATYYEADNNYNTPGTETKKSRSAVVFHELAENYERTTNQIDYSGAHEIAKNRESNLDGRSKYPGSQSGYQNPPITPEYADKLHEIINSYLIK